MISRTHRFHGHGSLRYVYQRGATVRGGQMALKYIVNERRKHYRLAVVVSKKVSKSAVLRNRIRRRIYEIVRNLEPQISKSYDMVVTVYNENLRDMPTAELASLVRSQLQQARILANSKDSHDKIDTKGEK